MKTKFFTVLLLVITIITGCTKDYIEKPVYGQESEKDFYKNTSQMLQALTLAYYGLKVQYNELSTRLIMVGDVSTDDNFKGGSGDSDQPQWLDMENFTMNTGNEEAFRFYSLLYQDINLCNIVINKTPAAEGDATLKTRIINEAKFLRALDYYYLATIYGDVSLVLNQLTPNTSKVPRSPLVEVYAQIEADLNDASNLPNKSDYKSIDSGRATKGAAMALLGRVYMQQGKYVEAENVLAQVISSKQYSLLPDFGQLWDKNNKNNRESVFEIMYLSNNLTYENTSGTNNLTWTAPRGNPEGYGFHCPTKDLYAAFDSKDPRITYTFINSGDKFQTENFIQDCKPSPSGYYDRKIYVPVGQRPQAITDIDKDWYIIRYADVLLMYAEALNENGKSNQAIVYLNLIRKRARTTNPRDPLRTIQVVIPATNASTSLPDITSTDMLVIKKAIWDERRVEFANEGLRRFDLIRQKRFGKVMISFAAKYGLKKGANFIENRDELFPIPLYEINVSNGVVSQNPGY